MAMRYTLAFYGFYGHWQQSLSEGPFRKIPAESLGVGRCWVRDLECLHSSSHSHVSCHYCAVLDTFALLWQRMYARGIKPHPTLTSLSQRAPQCIFYLLS